MDQLIVDIRTVLKDSKGGIRLTDLNREYKTLMGQEIPYRKLGFRNLEDYVLNEPRLMTYEFGSYVYVEATPEARPSHFAPRTRALNPKEAGNPPLINMPLRKPGIRNSCNSQNAVTLQDSNSSAKSQNVPPLPQPQKNPSTGERKPLSQRLMVNDQSLPDQVSSSVKSEQHRREVQEKGSTPSTVGQNSRTPSRRPNLSITIRQDSLSPSDKPQSAPVQAPHPNPLTNASNGSSDGRQVHRQNSLPHSRQTSRPQRPISDRLKRPPLEPQTEPNAIVNAPLTPPADENEKNDGEDPREKLRVMAKRFNLEAPEYTTAETRKGQKIRFYCKVKLGGKHTYSSFPLDACNEIEANKLAASAALDALQQLPDDFLKLKVTTAKEVIEERLLDILDAHPTGVFMKTLPDFYKQKHKEELPIDWEKIVEDCQHLSLNTEIQNVIVCKQASPVSLPPLTLPQDSLWQVYVSHVANVGEVWVRLDEDRSFLIMSERLHHHYSTINLPASSVEISKHYVMKEADEYLRIRVEGIDASGDARIFLIDTGEEGSVETSKLFDLHGCFVNYPAQAIKVSPIALEELAVCDTTTRIAENTLLDTSFYISVLTREKDEKSGANVVGGIFYDTREEPDVQVNEKIIELLHEAMVNEQLDVKLLSGTCLPVCVSSIQYNGDIYLQQKNDGLLILHTMLNCAVNALANDKDKMKRAKLSGVVDSKEIYVFRRPDNNWARVKVAFPKNTNSKMRMIDYGGLVEVAKDKLLRLKELSEPLTRFPVQAAQARLSNVSTGTTDKITTRLSKLAPTGVPLFCKVVSRGYDGVVTVELFSQSDNMLISINNTLEMDEVAGNGDGNNNVKSRKRMERSVSTTSIDSLKVSSQSKIPAVGDDFEVHIPKNSVANPWNFVVQPFEDKWKLESLMDNMQHSYEVDNGATLNAESIKEGTICAAKIHDGVWYRACIKRIIDEQFVAVYYCDFGNMNIVSTSQLQPLKKEFVKLPHQAIKARLFGVKPINGDWSTEACVRFQELVMDKDFMSIVKSTLSDEDQSNELVQQLELIDVSPTAKETHIHQILINESHAIADAQ